MSSASSFTKQASEFRTYQERIGMVTGIPGFVALWDFVKREATPEQRFTAHVRKGEENDFALDATNYVKDFWGEGRQATYEDFPQMGRGPFGNAIRIVQESDPDFRPCLYVPRQRLHNSGIDIKGAGKALTLVVWAIRERGGHALAGIWHEGTDLQQQSTEGILRAERGQRQYGLFTGLNAYGSSCAHISENGAGTYGYRYALHKANSAEVSHRTPADAPDAILDKRWECFGMTFDCETQELIAWLDGSAGTRWENDVKKNLSVVYDAWKKGEAHRLANPQDKDVFKNTEYYFPPEGEPISISLIWENEQTRIELHEFRYTKVKVTLQHKEDGSWQVMERDLEAVRLNPWWYPYDIYSPVDASSGGPFTIGRVIHSSRSIGTTGWIGGVAVFDRALNEKEMQTLAAFSNQPLVS